MLVSSRFRPAKCRSVTVSRHPEHTPIDRLPVERLHMLLRDSDGHLTRQEGLAAMRVEYVDS